MVLTTKPIYISYITGINDTCVSQGLESLVISYITNQSVDTQL